MVSTHVPCDVFRVVMHAHTKMCFFQIGKLMAKWSVSFETLTLFQDRLYNSPSLSPGEVLEVFVEAAEFKDITLRNNEKVCHHVHAMSLLL